MVEVANSTTPKVYFISGLGADERIFQWLDCDGYEPVYIQWLPPEKGEAIAHYAQRLIAQIDQQQIKKQQIVLVGLSFGGMIAIEIAKHIATQQIILLSSVKTTSEIPLYYRLFRWLPLHRIFPFKTLLWASYWLAYWLFNPIGPDQRQLLEIILQETDPHFLKWALHQVVIWNNQTWPENLVHIHGKSDRIFPHRFVSPNQSIDSGSHLMVMNQAKTISNALKTVLNLPLDQYQ